MDGNVKEKKESGLPKAFSEEWGTKKARLSLKGALNRCKI